MKVRLKTAVIFKSKYQVEIIAATLNINYCTTPSFQHCIIVPYYLFCDSTPDRW